MLLPFGLDLGENAPILSANQELRDQLDLLHEEGGVAKIQRDMLGGLLDLEDLSVSEVMIHRTKMRTINADLTAQEIVREVLSSPYTRMPLWRDSQENIIGVLHAKDLLRALDNVGGDADRLSIEEIALESWFVPDTTSLRDQLKAFLAKKTHFALVVDEYGEVMGLVTLEDILEEIVGDIKDEHDLSIQGVRPQPNGAVNVDGSVTDPGSQPGDGLESTRRRGNDGRGPRHPRSAHDSRGRSDLYFPRLPLSRAAQIAQPHHRAAHRAAGVGQREKRRERIESRRLRGEASPSRGALGPCRLLP